MTIVGLSGVPVAESANNMSARIRIFVCTWSRPGRDKNRNNRPGPDFLQFDFSSVPVFQLPSKFRPPIRNSVPDLFSNTGLLGCRPHLEDQSRGIVELFTVDLLEN